MPINPRIPRHLLPPDANKDGPPIQSKGVSQCVVIERREFPNAMLAARGGDYIPSMVMTAIHSWMGAVFGPTLPRPRCVTCDKHLDSADDAEAFFISIPVRGDGDAIVASVCKGCVRRIGSESLVARAIEHFKKTWPKATVTR